MSITSKFRKPIDIKIDGSLKDLKLMITNDLVLAKTTISVSNRSVITSYTCTRL